MLGQAGAAAAPFLIVCALLEALFALAGAPDVGLWALAVALYRNRKDRRKNAGRDGG